MMVLKYSAGLTLALLLAAPLAQAGCRGGGGGNGGGNGCSLANLPVEELNDFERTSLLQMREEEKLARDVYLTLGENFDLPVFTNIPRSEQRHLDQMGALLERYGLEDPVQNDERGKFTSPEIQKLYDDLVNQGSASETAALTVGATIEDLDIHDLESALAGGVDNQDIALVYRNLAKGSRNHLRAFTARLAAQGETYTAQHIAQADLEAIIASDRERGPAEGGQGQGRRGRGRGQGNCGN